MKFFLSRLAGFLVVLLGITFLVQGVVLLTPGDPILVLAGENVRHEDRVRLEKSLGLDRPFLRRWADSIIGLARFDLGVSFKNRNVSHEIRSAFPRTILLAAGSMAVAVTLGLAWGVVSAMNAGRALDKISLLSAVVFVSSPVFVTGLLLRYIFADRLRLLPAGGAGDILALVLPALTLGSRSAAYFARLARATLLDLYGEPFLRTARAKGRGEVAVVFRHLLPVAAGPLVAILFLDFASFLTGSVITETIFAWPGLGRLALSAVLERDLPLLQGVVLVMATTYAGMGLASDFLRALLDPRLRG